MTPEELCEVIVTAPDAQWLTRLCRELVDSRLAASAHVVHPATSIYRWQGAVEETTEETTAQATSAPAGETIEAEWSEADLANLALPPAAGSDN